MKTVLPQVHQKEASWKRLFKTSPKTDETQLVSIHYPRLFFYIILFLIPFLSSLSLVFLPHIFASFDRDMANNTIGFDFHIGIFYFMFRVDDSNFVSGLVPYDREWETMTYSDYCSTVHFQTRLSNTGLLDRNFFCEQHIWQLIQIFTSVAVGSGVLFVVLLLDNILVWQGYSRWFDPTRKSDHSVRSVRRFFKFGLMLCIVSHFAFQTCAMFLATRVWQEHLISYPTRITPYFGFYTTWASVMLDLLFLLFFALTDKYTFLHIPIKINSDQV